MNIKISGIEFLVKEANDSIIIHRYNNDYILQVGLYIDELTDNFVPIFSGGNRKFEQFISDELTQYRSEYLMALDKYLMALDKKLTCLK